MRFIGKAAAVAGAFLFLAAGAAHAEGMVAGVRGGALTDIDWDDSVYLVGGFAGYDFADDADFFDGNWRLQGELSFSSEGNGVDVRSFTLVGAAYREFAMDGALRPYVVVGAGGRFVHIETPVFDDSTSFFVLPLGVGLAIDLTDHLAVDLDYRVNMIEANSDFTDFAETSEISAYLRYNFGGN